MNTVKSVPVLKGWRSAKLNAAVLVAGAIVWSTSAIAALPAGGYADLVEKVSPAVVFISAKNTVKVPKTNMHGHPEKPFQFPPNSPLEEFFKRFKDQMPQQKRQMVGLGSGFIIDPTGYIVTNNHVIDGANKVQVKLQDGGQFTAKVVGTDAKTDLALLKIETAKKLPHVKFGDSSKLRVGNVVLAVGNPFGLGGTVTAGIVSARNRNINAGPYDDFIQTDAAVNRGNSGGPLFDTAGDVIGVNTAIYSPTGGSVGIGFAIPANLVKDVVAQLKDHGNVNRGWLGVKIQTVSPEIAQAMGLEGNKGALIAEVTPNSPAAKSGLRQGDVVLGYNGKPVKTMRDLPRLVATTQSGETAKLDLWRNGQKKSVSVTIGKLKNNVVAMAKAKSVVPGSSSSRFLGADLAALDDRSRKQLKLPKNKKGVMIARIKPEGPAATAGLQRGDVIEKIGSTKITKPADVDRALAKIKTIAALLLVNRRGATMFVGVKRAAV